MSDSEVDVPSEAVISQKLRDVVIAIHKSGNAEDLTLKRVRVRAEKELSLPDGFLKTDSKWKEQSKDIIGDAVVCIDNLVVSIGADMSQNEYCKEPSREPTPEPVPTPEPTPKKVAKPTVKKKQATSESTKGVKRKAAAPAKKPKKRRKTDSDDDDLESELSDPLSDEPSEAESEPPKKLVRRGKKTVTEDSDEEATPQKPTKQSKKAVVEEDSDDEPAATPVKKPVTSPPETKDDVSESELSSLIDESPKKKSRQKKEPASKAKKGAKPAAPKAKAAKPKADDDPDTAEVKRLQGWLVKCGIRKVWSRDPELSKCDTNKEKISVLKGMLKDVGMDGKYSVEKAAKIKEQREFAKDLAAIQEAEAHWGTSGDTAGGRPKRRAAAAAASKPQQKLVLSDDDEEEDADGGAQDDEESSDDASDVDDDDVKGESDDDKDDSEGDDSD